MSDTPITPLLVSWELHLRAERKSPQTLKAYSNGVQSYLTFCTATGRPDVLDRGACNAWVAGMLEEGLAPSTARLRQLALRLFSAWLMDEGEIDRDPLIGLKSPKLDTPVTEPLDPEQIRALLKACAGDDYRDRRDDAIVRLMLETGMRAGEVVALEVDDVDLRAGRAIVRSGKGGKGRSVPFGPHVARSLDRYLRTRRQHRLANSPALWLGDRGKGFTYYGLHAALKARAARAGIVGFHPHLMRHTAAHRWLEAGGSEGGLMAVAGWTRPDMLLRYTKAQASARAEDESRRLNLGDV